MNDTSGLKSIESFATYDPNTSCWRTSQATFHWGSDEFLGTWPRAGMTCDGIAFRLPPLAPLTDVIGSSSWPTPTTMDSLPPKSETALYKEATQVRPGRKQPNNLRDAVVSQEAWAKIQQQRWPTPRAALADNRNHTAYLRPIGPQNLENVVASRDPSAIGGKLNPTWVEWLMGFPTGWTDLEDSGTP